MSGMNKLLSLLKTCHFTITKQTESATHKQVCPERSRGSRKLTTPLSICPGIAMVLLILSVDIGSAKTFTTTDLEGTWNLHALASGYPDDFQSWAYGTMTCDSNGVFTQRTTNRTGEINQVKGMFVITREGIITIPGGSGQGSAFHGVMNNSKDTIVLTGNDGGGGYFLAVFTKSGGTFATSDLEGTWAYHGLISGNEPDQVPGWYYGSMTIDQKGNANHSAITDSEGQTDYIPHVAGINITADGIVTVRGMDSYHGAINQSKDVVVAVATMAPGRISSVRGYNLIVSIKQVPGAYTTGDLAGTWYAHGLVSGSYDDWTGWYYLTWLVDSQGKGNIVTGSYLNSHGETEQPSSGTMSITSDGIIRMSQLPSYHGIINLAKDMCVCTMDDGGGGYGLVIIVGRPAFDEFDFDVDGDVDFVDFANFASHWLN